MFSFPPPRSVLIRSKSPSQQLRWITFPTLNRLLDACKSNERLSRSLNGLVKDCFAEAAVTPFLESLCNVPQPVNESIKTILAIDTGCRVAAMGQLQRYKNGDAFIANLCRSQL